MLAIVDHNRTRSYNYLVGQPYICCVYFFDLCFFFRFENCRVFQCSLQIETESTSHVEFHFLHLTHFVNPEVIARGSSVRTSTSNDLDTPFLFQSFAEERNCASKSGDFDIFALMLASVEKKSLCRCRVLSVPSFVSSLLSVAFMKLCKQILWLSNTFTVDCVECVHTF